VRFSLVLDWAWPNDFRERRNAGRKGRQSIPEFLGHQFET
jgi:hypothetical protein